MNIEGAVGESLLDLLSSVVPPERLIASDQVLREYSHHQNFSASCPPILAVYPETKEELKELVRVANSHKIPLVPVSSGPPHFHGASAPSITGVQVDFTRMNRILKIDSLSRYAMIEPGVTYAQLIPELRKHGLRMDIPLCPRPSKSVVASRLEREPGLIPKYQYDYIDPLLTVEVIYGTGDEFRTGSASGPGPVEKLRADKVNPWGPGAIDFVRFLTGAQGTMGLVTWAIVKTEVLPSIQRVYPFASADLEPLVRLVNLVLRRRVVDECLILNNVGLAATLSSGSREKFHELCSDLPAWVAILVIDGYERRPQERVSVQEKHLQEICAQVELQPATQLGKHEGLEPAILDMLSNPFSGEFHWKLAPSGACREFLYLSPFSKVCSLAAIVDEGVAAYGLSPKLVAAYVQPCVQGRGCHSEFVIFCDENDPEQMSRVRAMFFETSEQLARAGAFFSRPYGPWADLVYRGYGEGVRVLRQLKAIFDPNNILNPGKLCF